MIFVREGIINKDGHSRPEMFCKNPFIGESGKVHLKTLTVNILFLVELSTLLKVEWKVTSRKRALSFGQSIQEWTLW